MFRLVYNLLWPVGLLLFLPRYLVKMFRRGGYREKFGQRLGLYDAAVRARLAGRRSLWLHAVSVGEVAVALKLLRELRARRPELSLALTTTTTTGFAVAKQTAPPGVEIMYMPLDFWPIMRRGFSVIDPSQIVLVEAEVWPNLVAIAESHQVPVSLVNARLSPRSEGRFLRFKRVVGPLFRQLDLIAVPDPGDVARWEAIGVAQSKIRIVGSVKFDPLREARSAADSASGGDEKLVLLGGSTHEGEEDILTDVFLNLRKEFASLRLFLAPRHVERARDVRKKLESRNLRAAFVSEGSSGGDCDCLILDKTGELQRWYECATIAFVGKSLTMHGGQNPVEPIVAGVPVLFGPNMQNFASLAQELVAKKAAIEVRDPAELEAIVANLLKNPEARRALVQNAEQVLARHRGATNRTVDLILRTSGA